VSNFLGSKLIKRFNEKIVGPYFAMLGSIILFLSVVSQNIYIIYMAIFIFGFLISNVMPIVYRESVKHSELPIPITISHVSSIAFTGVIFGPALVGLSAETFGLTFNMYLLGIIMFAIAILMLLIMQNSEQDKNTKSKII
jgi:predicted MFS family arabinose efflux permease